MKYDSRCYYYCHTCKKEIDFYYVNNGSHEEHVIDAVRKPKKGYWYEFYYSECVLCGSHNETKIRRYSSKPKDPADRYHFSQYACQSHFI